MDLLRERRAVATSPTVDIITTARWGDLAIMRDAGGWRVVQWLDATQSAYCWGDVVKTAGRESRGWTVYRESVRSSAAILVGRWFANVADARAAFSPHLAGHKFPAAPAGRAVP